MKRLQFRFYLYSLFSLCQLSTKREKRKRNKEREKEKKNSIRELTLNRLAVGRNKIMNLKKLKSKARSIRASAQWLYRREGDPDKERELARIVMKAGEIEEGLKEQ